jgi:small subunit ribosomal protein S4e
MSKKGGSNHFVRMRASKNIGVVSRKKVKWLLAPEPGTHKKGESISTGVLVRDVLGKASSIHEVKKILNSGGLLVDGKKITEVKFPIGIMDIISEPSEKKVYRMSLSGPKLTPREVKADAATRKYLKVVGKNVVKGGKISVSFHDGRNYLADKHISTGDTCVFSVPEFKLITHIKLAPGVSCLVMKGKHMGEVAKLDKIIERPGSHDTEALLSGPAGEFVTVVKYLFAIDANY